MSQLFDDGAVVIPLRPDTISSSPENIDISFQRSENMSMHQACKRLHDLDVNFTQLTGLQLKVNDTSFYPSTGSVVIDGQKKFRRKGLDFFLEVLRTRGFPKG
jgi:hypothetical protein